MKRFDLSYYINGLKQQNNVVLAQAITLVESKRAADIKTSELLLDSILQSATSTIRIGITGTPGVGKSSFIEVFGNYLIDLGKKVAVLAIDPSSQRAGGSILGDKTRMETLSTNPNAYIRPSASGVTLGGVNNKTREAILLCEAAGYDVIIVETVGVGQSETMVNEMVDFFLLMMQPGSGDDLQGIKKGIMEMAHGIAINKADGDQEALAKQSRSDLMSALHLFAPEEHGWFTKVTMCSALNKTGLKAVWDMICDFDTKMKQDGYFEKTRASQNVRWFENRVEFGLIAQLLSSNDLKILKSSLSSKIKQNHISVSVATRLMLTHIKEQVVKSL